jgi:3-hydroxymyristoyl/3-hydroxydecanoyl-(acyl carrier protein) dehydratase
VFPGVLLIEAGAQVAGILLAATQAGADGNGDAPAPGGIGYLVTVKHFRFREVVRPGDRLMIEAKQESSVGHLHEYRISERVDGRVVAEGSLAVAIA